MIVTSLNREGFDEYGQRFFTSFLENWKDEEFTVYHEEPLPEVDDNRITFVDLNTLDEYQNFVNLLKDSDPIFRGIMKTPENKKAYNFRYDANKFFRKVLAMSHYGLNHDKEVFAWLDADTVFTQTVPEDFLIHQLQDNHLAHLGRDWSYTETGFIVFNCPEVFFHLFWSMYSTGAFRYLGEFHDCYVFDLVSTLLNLKKRDLAEGLTGNQLDHPFIYAEIGKYADHLKGGNRKNLGFSPERKSA